MMGKQKFILIQFILVFNVFVNKTKALSYEVPSRCYNPNHRIGLCVSIYDCRSLLKVIETEKSSAYDFVRKSQCPAKGQGMPPYVCCTSDNDFTSRNNSSDRIIFPDDDNNDDQMNNEETTTTTAKPKSHNDTTADTLLLPKPPECGPVLIGNKIYGGQEAQLGEFPWLANLDYRNRNGDLISVCAGNILNQRYILTAAHCVKGDIEIKVGKLVSVRVGVHNADAPTNCNKAGQCLEPFQRMGVAKAIVHTGFTSTDGFTNLNDIALLRTDRNIQHSISVAPVCLPDVLPEMPQLRKGIKLSVAGWGHTGLTKTSAVKLKVELPYVENEVCFKNVAPEQLCAGGEFNKDSCTGDSGGGLVRLVDDAWVIEGIVSYGSGCGLEKPGVYTRVSSYLSWIRANVQP